MVLSDFHSIVLPAQAREPLAPSLTLLLLHLTRKRHLRQVCCLAWESIKCWWLSGLCPAHKNFDSLPLGSGWDFGYPRTNQSQPWEKGDAWVIFVRMGRVQHGTRSYWKWSWSWGSEESMLRCAPSPDLGTPVSAPCLFSGRL